jgi:hypothetical protein
MDNFTFNNNNFIADYSSNISQYQHIIRQYMNSTANIDIDRYNENIRLYNDNIQHYIQLRTRLNASSTPTSQQRRSFTFTTTRIPMVSSVATTSSTLPLLNEILRSMYPTAGNLGENERIIDPETLRQALEQNIETLRYEGAVKEEMERTGMTTCPISLEEFVEGERLSKIKICGHTFKQNGMVRWFMSNHTSCPVCRADVYDHYLNNEEESDEEDL